jgi:1-acyl-sn-glycerol-3-phosphate acyltransferase
VTGALDEPHAPFTGGTALRNQPWRYNEGGGDGDLQPKPQSTAGLPRSGRNRPAQYASNQGNPVMTKTAVSAVREYFWFYIALLYFGGAGLLHAVVSSVLYVALPRRVGARLGRYSIGAGFRSFLWLLQATGLAKLDLSALDALRGERGLLIAPNHPSLLDAVLVIARVPEVGCIMKATVQGNFVLGAGARLADYIRNDSGKGMVRLAAQQLREGEPLLVFPEGTRTRSPPLNSLKGGCGLIAKHTGAPIQTVLIETDSAYLGKGWPLLKKPPFPLVYRARLGKRYTVEGDVKAFIQELEHYYRQELAGQATAAQPKAARPTGSPHPGQAA